MGTAKSTVVFEKGESVGVAEIGSARFEESHDVSERALQLAQATFSDRVFEIVLHGTQHVETAEQCAAPARRKDDTFGPTVVGVIHAGEHAQLHEFVDGMLDVLLRSADAFRERGSVERNGAIYGDIRKKLDGLAGLDVFGAIAEYEKKVRGKPLNAQKWWA